MIIINQIDHIVLTVKNIEKTVEFYTTVLGMKAEIFGSGAVKRLALKFAEQKINLHEYGNEFEPKAEHPSPGTQDLCFITETDLEIAMQYVQSLNIKIIEGPVERTGAIGKILSFYIRDPDNNLIEVANYI